MSTAAATTLSAAAQPAQVADDRKPGYYVKTNLFFLAILVIAAIFAGYRIYQQFFASQYGLDATSPEFNTYWMTVVKIEIPALLRVQTREAG